MPTGVVLYLLVLIESTIKLKLKFKAPYQWRI